MDFDRKADLAGVSRIKKVQGPGAKNARDRTWDRSGRLAGCALEVQKGPGQLVQVIEDQWRMS